MIRTAVGVLSDAGVVHGLWEDGRVVVHVEHGDVEQSAAVESGRVHHGQHQLVNELWPVLEVDTLHDLKLPVVQYREVISVWTY